MNESGPRTSVSVQAHLRDQVADALRAALVAGELRPGVIYSAPALAAEYGVSATPVREAMLDLARQGLVEAVRNKGFRITEPSERELEECTELRALIEVPTVGRVTRTAERERLEALRPTAEETVTAARAGDLAGYLEADHRFHLDLLSLAGNTRLVETVDDLRRRSRLHTHADPAETGVLVDSAKEHVDLLDVMLTGDVEAAETHMRRHLARARSRRATRRQRTSVRRRAQPREPGGH